MKLQQKKRNRFIQLLLSGGAALVICGSFQLRTGHEGGDKSGNKTDKRPNIVVILADDLGFSDIGSYGGEIHTPNIDFLANGGLRFTNFYNTSRCCPTRASLLTGLYNQQAGIGEMTTDEHEPGYRGYLTSNTVTIAEVLKSAGYQTAMSGKWHISNTEPQPTKAAHMAWLNHQAYHPLFSPLEQYPTHRGFDHYYGTIWGVVDYFDPFSLVNGDVPVKTVPKDYYHTDAINDTAAAYIHQMSNKDQPFFLYLAENAPHWPLMAKKEDIAKYKDTYKVGWEAIREARYHKLLELGIIDSGNAALSPRWQNKLKWKDNPDSVWDANAMAVHAAMIDRMDQGIGRVIKALKETGELDNTLIVFLSDNGASAENCSNYGPGFDRPGETREGAKIIYATKKEVLSGPETTYTSIGQRWSNVANTPYRYWKAESYEGGIHTPMIAYWPKGLKVKPGSLTPQVGHVMDFMATFIELAHAKYPANFKGHDITPLEGISLAPVLAGKQRVGHKALFNEHFGGKYVRTEEWKMVRLNKDSTWNLYHIEADETELHNVAAQHPDVVKNLDLLWQQWAKKVHVFPKPQKQ